MNIIKSKCPNCDNLLIVKELYCKDCDLSLKGEFGQNLFHNLSPEDQKFVFDFVINSGSLKQLAEAKSKSYPTIRNMLDVIIEKLKLSAQKEKKLGSKKDIIADLVESGQMSTEAANKIIKLLKL